MSSVGGPGAGSRNGCPRVILYFSRGSGQPLESDERGLSKPGIDFYAALVTTLGPGKVGSMANAYPAVAITLAAIPKALAGKGYWASVDRGVQSATRNISDLARLCSQSDLILGGFSQGAQVTREVLPGLIARHLQGHIAAVVFFGDPYFEPGEQNVKAEGEFDHARSGELRRRLARLYHKPVPIDRSYAGKVFSWCHPLDIICQSKGGFAAHRTYGGDADEAVAAIVGRLQGRLYGFKVVGTCSGSTCALAEWSGPGTVGYDRVGSLYESQPVDIRCQTTGQTVNGLNGGHSAIWDELANTAFVSDYYIDTGGLGVYSPPIPHCRHLVASGGVSHERVGGASGH
jgi:Cutinase